MGFTINWNDEQISSLSQFVRQAVETEPRRDLETEEGRRCAHELAEAFAAYLKAEDELDRAECEAIDASRPWVQKAALDSDGMAMLRAKASYTWEEYDTAARAWRDECSRLSTVASSKTADDRQLEAIRAVFSIFNASRYDVENMDFEEAERTLTRALNLTDGNHDARRELYAALMGSGVHHEEAFSACDLGSFNPKSAVDAMDRIIRTNDANHEKWGVPNRTRELAGLVDSVARWA